jgi:hypothetical protein
MCLVYFVTHVPGCTQPAQPHDDVKVNVKGGDPVHVRVKAHENDDVNAHVKVNGHRRRRRRSR